MNIINVETTFEDLGLSTDALAEFLEMTGEGETSFRIEDGRQEWLFCTDKEADEAVTEYIRESIWAFNANFLESFTDVPAEMFQGIQDKCEGANEAFLLLVERSPGGLKKFVEEAVSSDGRGYFLASYDGEEHEFQYAGVYWYAYRNN